ncbi:MAG: hypothetical protein LIO86_02125 [Lachnospiraceae bacterium]|nr:hypothetical protein [Lachnospiraceae bacterium]
MKQDPFQEYMRESEPDKRDKGYAWHTAIGLQAVDGLTTSEYLERFLRNLLLNEKHPLNNRSLHISGTFYTVEKVNIEGRLTPKTAAHVQKLFEAFGFQTIFGRSDVQRVLGLKETRSSALLRQMAETGVTRQVSGYGKGKYCFQWPE